MFVTISKKGVPRGSIEITESAVNVVGMGAFFRRYAYEYDGIVENGDLVETETPSESAWRNNSRSVDELAKQLGLTLEEATWEEAT